MITTQEDLRAAQVEAWRKEVDHLNGLIAAAGGAEPMVAKEVRRLPLAVEFSGAYLEGVMEEEHPEIRQHWLVIRKYLHDHLRALVPPAQPQETQCKCSLRTKLVGDGCGICNPQQYVADQEEVQEQRAELSDKEIIAIADQHDQLSDEILEFTMDKDHVLRFARALLAAAKERT